MRPQLNYTITIHKDRDSYLDVLAASRKLNGVAFKMYIYFYTFKDGAKVEYSPGNFIRDCGSSRSAERVSFAELIKQNYLRCTNNTFEFYSVNE